MTPALYSISSSPAIAKMTAMNSAAGPRNIASVMLCHGAANPAMDAAAKSIEREKKDLVSVIGRIPKDCHPGDHIGEKWGEFMDVASPLPADPASETSKPKEARHG